MSKRLPWGHKSRNCMRCGKVGPRVSYFGGYVHLYCLTRDEQRERRAEQDREAEVNRLLNAAGMPQR